MRKAAIPLLAALLAILAALLVAYTAAHRPSRGYAAEPKPSSIVITEGLDRGVPQFLPS